MLMRKHLGRSLLGIALLATPVWPIFVSVSEELNSDDWIEGWEGIVEFFGHPLPPVMLLALGLSAPVFGVHLLAASLLPRQHGEPDD